MKPNSLKVNPMAAAQAYRDAYRNDTGAGSGKPATGFAPGRN
jgi:hypothetical protein